jgi:hypothetical protein
VDNARRVTTTQTSTEMRSPIEAAMVMPITTEEGLVPVTWMGEDTDMEGCYKPIRHSSLSPTLLDLISQTLDYMSSQCRANSILISQQKKLLFNFFFKSKIR